MTLRIEVDGRTLTFDESRPVSIGRATGSDVQMSAPTVSRLHAELRPGPAGWTLHDAGGQLGTFVEGQRITDRPLTGRTLVQCGPEGPGSTFTAVVEEPAPVTAPPETPPTQQWSVESLPAPPPPSAPAPAPGPAPAPPPAALDEPAYEPGFEPTYVLAAPSPTGAFPGQQQPRTGPDLLVEVEGQEHRFRHPEQVTIGRLPESRIVISDPVASRAHLRVDAVPGGWAFTNLSREGTFLDGRRVESQQFEDSTSLRLGHPSAGPAVTLVPVLSSAEEQARLAHKRTMRRLKVGGLGVGALALVAVLIVGSIALFGGGGTTDVTDPAALSIDTLNQAKSETVLIYFNDRPPGTPSGEYLQLRGSGSIISPDGLILTNAHVVAPNAPGLSEQYQPEEQQVDDPDFVMVRLTNPSDGYATDGAAYRARVVVADGDIDGAVIQIYADEDGTPVDPSSLNLPAYQLGDSSSLQSGSAVTVLGFPGIASSTSEDVAQSKPGVTVTSGVLSTIIPGSDGQQPQIDTDARIAPGNSGGSAIDNVGELIGVPSSVISDQTTGGQSGRIRPIDNFKALIDQAESGATSSPTG